MRQDEPDYVVARLPKKLFQELVAAKQGVEEFSPCLDRVRCDDGKVRRLRRIVYGNEVKSSSASGCYVQFRYDPILGILIPSCVGTCSKSYSCQPVVTPMTLTCTCKRQPG
jgi:hypothetical protein